MENIKKEWLNLLQETKARTSWTEELNSSDDSGASEWARRHSVLILGFPFLKGMISYEKIVEFFFKAPIPCQKYKK